MAFPVEFCRSAIPIWPAGRESSDGFDLETDRWDVCQKLRLMGALISDTAI